MNKNNSNILILEDDADQMLFLVDLAQSEVKKIISDKNISDRQRQAIKEIRIIKVSDINSLKKAVSTHKNIMLAILDCNTPDAKGSAPHDQLVKTNYRITGQHKSVDVVIKHIPDTPITLISSLDRFQRTVYRYYENKYILSINFIRKSDSSGISENFEHYLREYLTSIK